MERDVMDIVREKEFIELSDAERAELGELCSSEEEFNQMKAMFASIGGISWSNPTPRAETKESLDHLFAQKHPKAAPIWYNAPLAVVAPKNKPFYRQPLIQAAAVGLLIFLAYPIVKSNMMTSETTQVAALEKENTFSEMKDMETEVGEDAQNSQEVELKNEVETPAENEAASFDKMKSDEVETTLTRESNAPAPAPSAGTGAYFVASAATTVLDANEATFKDVSVSDAITPGSDHPDGIFIGDKKEILSIPASHEPAVFDLLTTTF